jgi:regulation of enolase protein 1 (concanavalin A-like superfamily)
MQLGRLAMAFEWQVAPADWTVGLDGTLRIVAGPSTDLFLDPAGGPVQLGAPRLMTAVDGDFQLSAYVKPDLQATFDAGALVLHAADRRWVKLALERSPQGQAMLVSVVTDGLSDDANGRVVSADGVWLRISRIGAACALHASDDGVGWDLVRHFALAAPDGLTAGFSAQSPTGQGCAVTFDGLDLAAQTLADLRDGS